MSILRFPLAVAAGILLTALGNSGCWRKAVRRRAATAAGTMDQARAARWGLGLVAWVPGAWDRSAWDRSEWDLEQPFGGERQGWSAARRGISASRSAGNARWS